MIQELAVEYPVGACCEQLEVSRSGYHAWRDRGSSKRQQENHELAKQIKIIHEESRGVYGAPRIIRDLHELGYRYGKNRIARIMRIEGIKGVQKRKYRPKTTDSNHKHPISPNRLSGMGVVNIPDCAWASDITYIPTREGWLYLSVFMDLASRMIKGWALKSSLKAKLVSQAFSQACSRYHPGAGLIIHSDRGRQYASDEFSRILHQHKALGSMGRTGNCYDNATVESFFATLKTELMRGKPFDTKEEARLALFDYIEIFYNRKRRHSSLDYQSPLAYEAQLNINFKPPLVSIFSG